MSELTWRAPTWQSSTDFGGESVRAVDGNTDGFFWNGSVTHTALQDNPEWGVWIRPGRVVKIVVWNTDRLLRRSSRRSKRLDPSSLQ